MLLLCSLVYRAQHIWVLGDIITVLTIVISQHIYAITVHSFIERNSIWVLGDIITILTIVK